jgi:UDP-N-acetylglucosamine--N-acetylmuramyl-(pentapeptide) pyrophosphoryl-undecaprenol N-acetylglucosamine transferase
MAWALTSRAGHGRQRAQGVAFAGGGTGGHVFPAIAVAEELSRLISGRMFWIGSRSGMEKAIVTHAGIPFHGIPAGKLRRYFSLSNFTDLIKIAAGIVSSAIILAREKPALLFSKGGFVSVPPVIAASLCGIPCYTHESDLDPGLATRINLRFCEKIFLSFDRTMEYLPPAYRKKAVVSGNPVRGAMYLGDSAAGRRIVGCGPHQPLLLVLGGSLGSSAVNALISSVLSELTSIAFVVHQTGEKGFESSSGLGEGYFTAPFFREELPHLMAAADIVVSRAGANSLAELSALGKPSILIPLPEGGTSRGDQVRNAEYYASKGAAVILRQEMATGARLLSLSRELLADPLRLKEMGKRALEAFGARGGETPAAGIARMILTRVGASAE